MSFGFDAPAYWDGEPGVAADGSFCGTDTCVMRDGNGEPVQFVRGVIEIPVPDATTADESAFSIGVWVSLSEKNFTWLLENWSAEESEQRDPWFGWLSNRVPVYPDTLNLKTHVRLQGERRRPLIELEPTDHPLPVDQRRGVTLRRAHELAQRWLHA